SGSTLYGTASAGPGLTAPNNGGVVFSLPVTGGTPTVLGAFTQDGPNGSNPQSRLTLSGNTLYGTTQGGGTTLNGALFSVPVTGGTPTALFSFASVTGNGTGGSPSHSLLLSGGTLYGTTENGGTAGGLGTVFSVPVAGGTPTILASFDVVHGATPTSGLTL